MNNICGYECAECEFEVSIRQNHNMWLCPPTECPCCGACIEVRTMSDIEIPDELPEDIE
jgi:predicted nucleic acid-binding Zn ribbon protein